MKPISCLCLALRDWPASSAFTMPLKSKGLVGDVKSCLLQWMRRTFWRGAWHSCSVLFSSKTLSTNNSFLRNSRLSKRSVASFWPSWKSTLLKRTRTSRQELSAILKRGWLNFVSTPSARVIYSINGYARAMVSRLLSSKRSNISAGWKSGALSSATSVPAKRNAPYWGNLAPKPRKVSSDELLFQHSNILTQRSWVNTEHTENESQ